MVPCNYDLTFLLNYYIYITNTLCLIQIILCDIGYLISIMKYLDFHDIVGPLLKTSFSLQLLHNTTEFLCIIIIQLLMEIQKLIFQIANSFTVLYHTTFTTHQ